jgi:superfamily II DNA or RNA helicase
MQLCPVRYRVDARGEAALRPFTQHLMVRDTTFAWDGAHDPSIQELYAWLARDGPRNDLIVADVLALVADGRAPLVLTERKEHLGILAARLADRVRHVVILEGGLGARRRREALERALGVPDGESRVILATGRYVGEGYDDPRLDTLLLAMPISWKGTLVQYAGRLHRPRAGKTEVRIYDYVDRGVPMLARMHERRLRTYRAMGYGAGEGPRAGHELRIV